MKIDKSKLKQIIQEETQKLLQEDWRDVHTPSKSETLPWTTALGRLVNKYANLFPERTGQTGAYKAAMEPRGKEYLGAEEIPDKRTWYQTLGWNPETGEETLPQQTQITSTDQMNRMSARPTWDIMRPSSDIPNPAAQSFIKPQPSAGEEAALSAAEVASMLLPVKVPFRTAPWLRGKTSATPGPSTVTRPSVDAGVKLGIPSRGLGSTAAKPGPAVPARPVTRIKYPEKYGGFLEQYKFATEAAMNQPLTVNDMRGLMRIYQNSNFDKSDLLRAIESNLKTGTFKQGAIEPKDLLAFFEQPGMPPSRSLNDLQAAIWDLRAPRTMSPFPDLRTGEVAGWTGSNRASEIAREAHRLGLEPFDFYPFGEKASIYDFSTGKLIRPGEVPISGWAKQMPKKPATVQKFPSGRSGDYRDLINYLEQSSSVMHDDEYRTLLRQLGFNPGDLVFESITKSKFKKILTEEYNELLKEHAAQYVWGVKAPYNRVANKYNLHRIASEKLSKLKL